MCFERGCPVYILTNHICGCIRNVTVFVDNETHSGLIRLVDKLLSCRHTSCTCLILCRRAGRRRHCTFAIIGPVSSIPRMWLNQRVNTMWSSVNKFAQIIEANFLCRDECVTTQSITDFGHRFGVLVTRFTSNAQSSAKFPFMDTCCVSAVDICACTRFSMISSSVTQVLHRRNS